MSIPNPVLTVSLPEIEESLLEKIDRLIYGRRIDQNLKATIRALSLDIKKNCEDERREPTEDEQTAQVLLEHALEYCLERLPDPVKIGSIVDAYFGPPFVPLTMAQRDVLYSAKEDGLSLSEAVRLAGVDIDCASPYWHDRLFAYRLQRLFLG